MTTKQSFENAVVIGQGAAGLTAALALGRAGVSVTSLGKTNPGTATCTIYAGGGFTLGVGGMSTQEHREMTMETGRQICLPDLLDSFTEGAPEIVEFMQGAGVPLGIRRGGVGIRRDPSFPLLGGKLLTDNLHRACLDSGVSFVSGVVATRLLLSDKGVWGVECIRVRTGEALVIQADAVVLATGGAGALFQRTDNPQRITGDGYRLAHDVGCRLLDMEFIQFYPIGLDIPGGAHWFLDLGIIDRARLTNCEGREFVNEMLREEGIDSGRAANLLARDKCTVAIALELQKGPVLLHLQDIPEEVWEKDRYLGSIGRMFPRSSPPWAGPVNVQPIQHYFPGGVEIGRDAETQIPGLFACGEVTGGVDGANRVGGNALTNCILFGKRAGEAAAAYILEGGYPPLVSRVDLGDGAALPLYLPVPGSAQSLLRSWTSGDPGDDPRTLRAEIRACSSRCLMPVREKDSLESGLSELDGLGERLWTQRASTEQELLFATENLGLWHTAKAAASAALVREESRGAHYRLDHPREDPSWQKHLFIERTRQ